MGDDLDELLDEVEEKFCSNTHLPVATEGEYTRQTTTVSELDRIISDICDDDPTVNKDLLRPSKSQSKLQSFQGRQKRCVSVFLGGANISLGHSDGTVQRACDKLRCTSCDFLVVWFSDSVWHSRSEYLFFRNNYPEFDRLKKNLVRKKGELAMVKTLAS